MIEDQGYTVEELDKLASRWLDRIEESRKREKIWWDDAEWAENAYLCGTKEDGDEAAFDETPEFNIIHSNSETVIPAVYNSTPSPDIRPRHGNSDPGAKEFADALERAIQTQIDDDKLTSEIEALAQDMYVAGRGITRIRFAADVGETGLSGESVVFENVSWRDYREGPAKRWSGVPWVAYRHYISQDEADRLTDEEIATAYADRNAEDEEKDVSLWEIWCKETRRVYMVIEDTQKLISVRDDPLGLKGFFPQPNTVQPIKGTGRRMPVNPHKPYRRLSKELDIATRRINAIMKGLKVRGLIAANAEAVEVLAMADDNELVPVPDLANTLAQGGLEKAIAWWPLDMAISVLQQLYVQREQVKMTIYEVTGISDIVRGVSDPRETAEAQRTKSQWGSQRIKRMQRMIQSHVRDLFILSAEIMARHFTIKGFARAAGVQPSVELSQMMGRLDNYRIDIESDSTIRADLTHQRQEMAEFMRATGEFMGMMAPIVEKAPQATGAIMEIYASFAGSFQLGKRAEDALQDVVKLAEQAGQNQPPDPEVEAKKAELQVEGQRIQIEAQKVQADARKAQSDAQLSQQKLQIDAQKAMAEMALKRMDMGIKSQQLGLQVNKQELDEAKAQFDAAMKLEEIDLEREQKRAVAVGE